MADPLWGVAVGGVIGLASPLLSNFFERSRWKRQARFDWLKAERLRLEAFYSRKQEELAKALADGNLDIALVSDFFVLLPKEAGEALLRWRALRLEQHQKHGVAAIEPDSTRVLLLEIGGILRRDLKRIDDEIVATFR